MRKSDDPSPIEPTAAVLALLASSVGDPEGTRTITAIVLLLAVLGIALVMIAIWLFRLTRPDKELLAPLELMGERKWRRADPVWQRRRLDQVRPTEAQPLQPSAAPPDFDEAFFEHVPAAAGFDDLHDEAHRNGESPAGTVASEVPASELAEPQAEADAPAAVVAHEASIASPTTAKDRDAAPVSKPISPTPIGIERSMDLPERDIDPEVMAAAIAELDAELRLGRDPKPQPSD